MGKTNDRRRQIDTHSKIHKVRRCRSASRSISVTSAAATDNNSSVHGISLMMDLPTRHRFLIRCTNHYRQDTIQYKISATWYSTYVTGSSVIRRLTTTSSLETHQTRGGRDHHQSPSTIDPHFSVIYLHPTCHRRFNIFMT